MSKFYLASNRYNVSQHARYSSGLENKSIAANASADENPNVHGSYAALILHPLWKARRKEILERDQHQCVICSSREELQVHHRQYHFIKANKKFKAPWEYPGHLLITLCSKCHARGHSKYKVPSINI